MPSVQRGQVEKRGDRWSARWRDETGRLRRRTFGPCREGKADASAFLNVKIDEVAALRRGDPVAIRRQVLPTLGELVDEYLAQHVGEENTKRTLRERLRYATEGPKLDGHGWKDLQIDRLNARDVAAWRSRLPERSAWGVTKALRACLNYAVRVELLARNPTAAVPNPEPKRCEVRAFESVAELEAVGAELSPAFQALPLFAGLTGLRPEEWIPLTRADIDRDQGIVHVRRVYTDGQVKTYGKQAGSLRAVPLPTRAAQALAQHPQRLDTRLLFPARRGSHLNLHEWRRDEWTPAVRAAGLEHRSPYALRHTFATFAIAAGIGLFELARLMGTSVEQIDKTYGHLLPDSLYRSRMALDRFFESRVTSGRYSGAER